MKWTHILALLITVFSTYIITAMLDCSISVEFKLKARVAWSKWSRFPSCPLAQPLPWQTFPLPNGAPVCSGTIHPTNPCALRGGGTWCCWASYCGNSPLPAMSLDSSLWPSAGQQARGRILVEMPGKESLLLKGHKAEVLLSSCLWTLFRPGAMPPVHFATQGTNLPGRGH